MIFPIHLASKSISNNTFKFHIDTPTVIFGLHDHSNSHAKCDLAFSMRNKNTKIDIWKKHMPNNILLYLISKEGPQECKNAKVLFFFYDAGPIRR